MVPEKIHTHAMEGHWKWGGVLIAKIFEAKYEAGISWGEGECKTRKKPTLQGVDMNIIRILT